MDFKTILRYFLAGIIGLVAGMIVMIGFHYLFAYTIGLPEGVDMKDISTIDLYVDRFQPIHYLTVIAAHGLGTLAGAFVAAKLSLTKKYIPAIAVGAFFLVGGYQETHLHDFPMWHEITDVIIAYIPMALLGWKLAGEKSWIPAKR